ncbi:DNA-processing protein DprA [Flindersiella endophytica]
MTLVCLPDDPDEPTTQGEPGSSLAIPEPIQPVPDVERVARAALLAVAEPGDLALGLLVAKQGAAATLAAIREGELPVGHRVDVEGRAIPVKQGRGRPRLADYRTRLPAVDPERDFEAAAKVGARLICPGDAEWPESLELLTHAGTVDGGWGGSPLALWVRGDADLARISERSVAVVGARASSEYGQYVASELSAGLADRGFTVVSGAAYGIDAAAHRGAMAASGQTIAVLACGVDLAYPRPHKSMLDRIAAESGLVLSEVPPGTHPTRPRFLIRNRLIAAITLGTVVVEAALRSGALNTAAWAERCQREVMGVPGPITAAESAGVHRLIRDGAAMLVTDAAEIAEHLGRIGEELAPPKLGGAQARDRLDSRTRRVLEAVPVSEYCPAGTIATAAGVPIAETLTALGTLWMLDFVEHLSGTWRLSERERGRCRHRRSEPPMTG